MASYEVRRHGGNGNHGWRVVLETADEARARARFERERERMRQRGVALLEVDGEEVKVLERAVAPRVRTRW